jgi:pimeloyl-ACP methyl ester carboxylesterase
MVAKQLCKQARVMVYDRAGYGFSSPAPAAVPRTSEQLAHELHQLLGCLDLAPPYLLVGHSFGGFVVRCFANHYPTEVAAVLLVDAVHEDEWTTQFPLGYRLADRSLAGALAGLAQLARWRMLSWLEPFLPGNSSKLPDQYQRLASQLMLQTHSLETAQRELADMPISAVQARAASFPAIPLTVLGRGQPNPNSFNLLPKRLDKQLRIQQRKLAQLSPLARRRTAKKSGHDIHLDNPKRVCSAVERLLKQVS